VGHRLMKLQMALQRGRVVRVIEQNIPLVDAVEVHTTGVIPVAAKFP
jgi:hypothetical protein